MDFLGRKFLFKKIQNNKRKREKGRKEKEYNLAII
jgi:hypothetical protein